MLQNAGADRVFVIRLLLARTNADEQGKNSYGLSQLPHSGSSLNDELRFLSGLAQPIRHQRQIIQADARGIEQCIADGWRHRHDRRLSGSR